MKLLVFFIVLGLSLDFFDYLVLIFKCGYCFGFGICYVVYSDNNVIFEYFVF